MIAKDAEEQQLIYEIIDCRTANNIDVWYSRLTRGQRKKVDLLLRVIAAIDADDTCIGIISLEERDLLERALSCETLFDKSELLSSTVPELRFLIEHFINIVEISRLYEDENYHPDNFAAALEVISKIKAQL
jgi:hypothetical protein